MALNYEPQTATAAEYAQLFETERAQEYPAIDALEQRYGFAVDRERLERAARILSTPKKAHPPNWQHGRVIYSVARHYFETVNPPEPVSLLDIGTAKGFSALCLEWAREDARILGNVTSLDVIPPSARVRRNTVAEVDGLRTLAEILAPFPEASAIRFLESRGVDYLRGYSGRIHVAFVDGKHTAEAVSKEGAMISAGQEPGDVVIFDDIQIPSVGGAVRGLRAWYEADLVEAKPGRMYAIARRK